MRTLSLNLGNHLEGFVKKQIQLGNYSSENEVVKEALENLEKKKSLEMLENAILEGENSGPYKEFDSVAFLKEIKEKYVK
jgi:antitoxin ParD1/3/4